MFLIYPVVLSRTVTGATSNANNPNPYSHPPANSGLKCSLEDEKNYENRMILSDTLKRFPLFRLGGDV